MTVSSVSAGGEKPIARFLTGSGPGRRSYFTSIADWNARFVPILAEIDSLALTRVS
jgi:hypothetical protein